MTMITTEDDDDDRYIYLFMTTTSMILIIVSGDTYNAPGLTGPTLEDIRVLNEEMKFRCPDDQLKEMVGKSAAAGCACGQADSLSVHYVPATGGVDITAIGILLSLATTSGLKPHSERRFPAPSSRRCQNWLRH